MFNKLAFYVAKVTQRVFNPSAKRHCKIDRKASVCYGCNLNWVNMGKYSYIGHNCFMVNVSIGNYCSIADFNYIGGAIHPMQRVSSSPVFHSGKNVLKRNFADFDPINTPVTSIGNDVWIGMGCHIKAGVTIGNGAVIGMGSVVTKDVPAYEIWAGNPARKINDRFDDEIKMRLLNSEWWNWSEEEIIGRAKLFNDVAAFLSAL